MYGRLCFHTLPVLRDYYPVGPLEAGLQLTQLTRGPAGAHVGNSLVIQNQSTLEPLRRSPETSYAAEHMLAKSKATDRKEGAEAADTQERKDQAKVR